MSPSFETNMGPEKDELMKLVEQVMDRVTIRYHILRQRGGDLHVVHLFRPVYRPGDPGRKSLVVVTRVANEVGIAPMLSNWGKFIAGDSLPYYNAVINNAKKRGDEILVGIIFDSPDQVKDCMRAMTNGIATEPKITQFFTQFIKERVIEAQESLKALISVAVEKPRKQRSALYGTW